MVIQSARVALLRHGQADFPGRCYGQRCDPPLSETGRAQVRAAAPAWAGVDRVVSSPSLRAQESAREVTSDYDVDDRFAERDFGEWEGRLWEELWPTVSDEVQTDPVAYAAFTPPGGESLQAVQARVWQAVQDVAAPGETVLVVTSAGPVRLAVGAALDLASHRVFAVGAAHGRAAELVRHGSTWTLDRLGV